MWMRRSIAFLAGALLLAYSTYPPTDIRAQATLANQTMRPFVTGIIPVIGANGEAGGVIVDAKGVVSRVETGAEDLAPSRAPATGGPLKRRFISLTQLEEAFAESFARDEAIPEEMLYLAGLQRVEYVFADPIRKDIILAGPGESWRLNTDGTATGLTTGKPTLRLDDLLEALRTAEIAVEGDGISCSIDPSEEGIQKFERLLRSPNMRFSARTAQSMKKAMGRQHITITGVLPDSHFARVMVAADYMMKRLAMGLEPSPVAEMPSYMELLKSAQDGNSRTASPRFWMAVDYEPLLRSEDGLSWQIRGPGVKVMSEEAFISASGLRVTSGETDEFAAQFASTMTKHYDELSTAMPVFGELRNCMDLAVVAALVAQFDLVNQSGAKLPILTGSGQARGPVYDVPTTVDSEISAVRAGSAWIIGVSGGVDLDSWSVLREPVVGKIDVASNAARRHDKWWWEIRE